MTRAADPFCASTFSHLIRRAFPSDAEPLNILSASPYYNLYPQTFEDHNHHNALKYVRFHPAMELADGSDSSSIFVSRNRFSCNL